MTRLDAYCRIAGESEPQYRVTQPGRADRMETVWPRLVKAFWAHEVPSWSAVGPVVKARVRLVKRGRR